VVLLLLQCQVSRLAPAEPPALLDAWRTTLLTGVQKQAGAELVCYWIALGVTVPLPRGGIVSATVAASSKGP